MTNNVMSFGIYGNKIVTKYIDSNDNLVLPEETFAIEWKDGGFMIRPEYDATHYIGMTYNPTSTSGSTVGTDLVLVSGDSYSTPAKWNFTRYTGSNRYSAPLSDILDCDVVGNVVNIRAVVSSTVVNCNTPEVSINSIDDSSKLFYWWNSSNDSAIIMSYFPVNYTISIALKNPSGTTYYLKEYIINSKLAVEEGQYLIQNIGLNNYMQRVISDDDHFELQQFTGNNDQTWNITHIRDGYYSIINADSGLAISVRNGYEDTANIRLVESVWSNTSNQQWRITKTESGGYTIKAKSAQATVVDWYMGVSNGLSSIPDGRTIMQNTLSSNSVWRMIKKNDLTLVALPASYDRTSFFSSVITNMNSIGYDDYYDNRSILSQGIKKSEMIARMAFSKITVIRTHGSQSSIVTSDG